jgi:NADH-quinone oxidoreductase subunit J
MIHIFAFYLFATLMIASGAITILARNPVHSVLWLILAFFNAAGLMVLIGAEFIAMLLVIVYVGAVAVLFLFVVMMLDINIEKLREGFWSYLPVGATVALLMVAEMALVLTGPWFGLEDAPRPPASPAGYSNTKELGRLLYTDYVYPFELAAVILLVAIVAAIALTLRRRKHGKYIDPGEQVRVKRNDRLKIISMPAEKKGD